MRLDIALAEILSISRQKTKELLLSGRVNFGDEVLSKPSIEIEKKEDTFFYKNKPLDKENLKIKDEILISRAGYKLKLFLQSHPSLCRAIECAQILDVGASAGGFAQIFLHNGAEHITCVDVGSGQLHKSLRENLAITSLENTDIREFRSEKTFDVLSCDVSFISLRLVLEALLGFCATHMILLFKPQFELPRDIKRNKKGVILDRQIVLKELENFVSYFKEAASGYEILAIEESKICGKDGNIEYFIYAGRQNA